MIPNTFKIIVVFIINKLTRRFCNNHLLRFVYKGEKQQ